LDRVLHAYVRFNRKRAEQRSPSTAVTNCFANLRRLSSLDYVVSRDVRSDNRYKTRLCRDVEAGRACRRGLRCTYAHCDNELRRTPTALKPSLSLPIRGENGSLLKRINECDGFVNDSNDTATLQHNIVSCMSNAPPTLPRLNSPRAPPPPCNAQQITAPNPRVPIIPMRMPPQPPNQNAVLFDSAQPIQVPLPVVPVIIPPARYIDSANSPNAPIQIAPQNQGLSNAMIAPNTVIQFPIHAPPPPHQPQFLPPPNQPQLHINHNQNALQWTQNCVNGSALNEQPPPAAMIPPSAGGGALQMNLPLECVETQWNVVDRTTCRSAPVQPVAAFEEIVHHGEMNNYRIMKRSEQEDEEQLMMRRKEIISRLVDINQKPNGISVCEESFDEDDLQSHVSYTVASSVLYDDKDTFTSTTLHLPPLPLRFTSASNVDDAVSVTNCLSDLNKTTTVLTVCPPPCVWTNIAKPATVQSPCSVMTIKDMINLPLATPAIQRSHVPHLAVCQMKDSNCIPNSCIPPVIRPLPSTSQDPQNVVSETLDRIVDVRERLNDVEKNSGLGCSVEKQQLKEELNIINRQIQTLDQQTKQSCLLKELEVVDKKIEHLNVHC
uniref:C3H1-type domain-containing protein n=1 Tax=Anisakis simplex TaxID=6269 RepID=A0A0M3K542_ANISI